MLYLLNRYFIGGFNSMKKINLVIIGIFLVSIIGLSIYFLFFYINLNQYNFYTTLRNEISPNGQYKVDLILLGKKEEQRDRLGNLTTSNNETYDEYARLWYSPETRGDGTVMWYDKNTKIIYYEKDCIKDEIQWIDDSVIKINGVTLSIHKDIYDYRRK